MEVGANTATRIGQLLLDILASTAFEFDPDRAYGAGEYIIWQGRNVRALQPTIPGESPTSKPEKWDDPIIDSEEKLVDGGNNYAVLANALKSFVTRKVDEGPTGGDGGTGSGRKATQEEMNDGLNDTSFVTPFLVNLVVQRIIEIFGQDDVPTLDAVAKSGDADTIGKTSQLLKLLGGLYLDNIPTTTDATLPVLVLDADGKVWKRNGSTTTPSNPVITHRFRNPRHYAWVEDTVVTLPNAPLYTLRLDVNDCSEISGWAFDENNPTASTSVDIKVDGTTYKTITAGNSRPDVREALIALGKLPAGTTFDLFGYRHYKDATYADGKKHTWRVFGKDSTTEAITDTGAPNDKICGTVTAPQPYVTQRVWRGYVSFPEGETRKAFIAELWSDNRTETRYTGQGTFSLRIPYPNGVTVTNSTPGETYITVPALALNANVDGVLEFTFPDGQKMPDLDIVFVNDTTVNNPPVLANPTQFLNANQGSGFDYPVPATGTFTDPDNDPLTFAVEYSADNGATYSPNLPSWVTYVNNRLAGTPPVTSSQDVTYKFRTVASDGRGGTAVDPISLICTPQAQPNAIQYVQFRYLRGSGTVKDLLEVQMADTYPLQPMRYAIVLASSGTPTDGFLAYNRVSGIRNAAIDTASAGTLAGKKLRIAITRKDGALDNGKVYAGDILLQLDFTVPPAATPGFVNIYNSAS
ncbi:hypothetical protein GCM10027085_46060 [Spirosoma aerophilum]